jgi:cephalosporin hydroxylase
MSNESHSVSLLIRLVEGSSYDPTVVSQMNAPIGTDELLLVLLYSHHARPMWWREIEAYAPIMAVVRCILACNTIMQHVSRAPRTELDGARTNGSASGHHFLATHPEFEIHEPERSSMMHLSINW